MSDETGDDDMDDLKIIADRINNAKSVPDHPTKKRFQFTPASQIKIEPVEWLIDGYIERSAYTIFYGESQSFKTFCVLDMALCLSQGMDWHGSATKKIRVAYIAGEGQRGIARRIMGWCKKNGVQYSDIDTLGVSNMPSNLMDKEATKAMVEAVIDFEPDLIILDTIARNFGGDAASPRDVNELFRVLDNYVIPLNDAGIWFVGHPGHNKERLMGSYQWLGNADCQIRIERQDGTMKTQLTFEKQKDAEFPEGIVFEAEVIEVGEDIDTLVLNKLDEGVQKTGKKKGSKIGKYEQILLGVMAEGEDRALAVLRDDFKYEYDHQAGLPGAKFGCSKTDSGLFRKRWAETWKKVVEKGECVPLVNSEGITVSLRKLTMFEKAGI